MQLTHNEPKSPWQSASGKGQEYTMESKWGRRPPKSVHLKTLQGVFSTIFPSDQACLWMNGERRGIAQIAVEIILGLLLDGLRCDIPTGGCPDHAFTSSEPDGSLAG
jgi:hypothetical protein